MKKIFLIALTALLSVMGVNAQTIKVYKNGEVVKTYKNTEGEPYKVVFENSSDLTKATFSVSTTKVVKFTKGNVQATFNGSKYIWSIAKNPWDYVGDAPGNTTIRSQENGKVVDHFAWSTTATNYGIRSSNNATDYIGVFEDWGNNFPGKKYSTLSGSEWAYLLWYRTVNSGTGEGYSYKKTTLSLSDNSTVDGLLIAPDNYTGTLDSKTSWSDWQTMESVGVVFLPAAGNSAKTGGGNVTVSDVNSNGYYWTSSDSGEYGATYIELNALSNLNFTYRQNGFSVRLVSVVSE